MVTVKGLNLHRYTYTQKNKGPIFYYLVNKNLEITYHPCTALLASVSTNEAYIVKVKVIMMRGLVGGYLCLEASWLCAAKRDN